jgi:hypothetical protein
MKTYCVRDLNIENNPTKYLGLDLGLTVAPVEAPPLISFVEAPVNEET